uniref:Uncharacterized protein n=1 Tax=Pseudomonas phage BL5 TaxID=3109218 RepID=A0AAU7B9Q5_9VIRU
MPAHPHGHAHGRSLGPGVTGFDDGAPACVQLQGTRVSVARCRAIVRPCADCF